MTFSSRIFSGNKGRTSRKPICFRVFHQDIFRSESLESAGMRQMCFKSLSMVRQVTAAIPALSSS
jgi:hypothetical protein